MKKILEITCDFICNFLIFIVIWFWFYFLVMFKLLEINPEILSDFFGWNDADVALWNIRNTISSKFVIIFVIMLFLWIWLFCRRFFTEKKNISKKSLWIIIKSIILIVLIECSRFLLWIASDYTAKLENNQWANVGYNTSYFK